MHPSLLWPGQPELYQVEDAWMIGEALYVAPVVRQGQTAREVILPPGEWWALNEGKPVRGPARIVAEAPFGQVPRFLRRGYILPRFVSAFDTLDDVSTARVGHLGDDLEVWLYPAKAQAFFTLFDGTVLTRDAELPGPRRVSWRIFG
jgi:hypothetical protein